MIWMKLPHNVLLTFTNMTPIKPVRTLRAMHELVSNARRGVTRTTLEFLDERDENGELRYDGEIEEALWMLFNKGFDSEFLRDSYELFLTYVREEGGD